MGATMMIPVKSFKDKAQAQRFGTAFALFSQALGANGKQVMHEFESKTKNQDKTQTTSEDDYQPWNQVFDRVFNN